MNEEFKKFMEGIGILTEFAFALYMGFLNAGFNPDQALELTKSQLIMLNNFILDKTLHQKEDDDD